MNRCTKAILCFLLSPYVLFGMDNGVTLSDGDAKTVEYKTTKTQETHTLSIGNGHAPDKWSTGIKSTGDNALWSLTDASDDQHIYKIEVKPEMPLFVTIKAEWEMKKGNGKGKKREASVSVPKATDLTWVTDRTAKRATDPTKRSRLGIGELVTVNVANSHLGNPTWEINGPQGAALIFQDPERKNANWYTVRFVSGEKAGICTITANYPTGDKKKLSFEVENLTRGSTTKYITQYTSFENKTYCLARMLTGWKLGNDYCSFENVQYGESDEDMAPGSTKAMAVWGRYVGKDLDHKPKPPEIMASKIVNWEDNAEIRLEASAFKTNWQGGGFRWDIQEGTRPDKPRLSRLARWDKVTFPLLLQECYTLPVASCQMAYG